MDPLCKSSHSLASEDRMPEISQFQDTSQRSLYSVEIVGDKLSCPVCHIAHILSADLVSKVSDIYTHRTRHRAKSVTGTGLLTQI